MFCVKALFLATPVFLALVLAFSTTMSAAQAQTPTQKRYSVFAARQRAADKAVPAMRNGKDQMDHYTAMGAGVEKHGYRLGVNASEVPRGG
jgi:hypothetical protein